MKPRVFEWTGATGFASSDQSPERPIVDAIGRSSKRKNPAGSDFPALDHVTSP
jgi:hypothetical protein